MINLRGKKERNNMNIKITRYLTYYRIVIKNYNGENPFLKGEKKILISKCRDTKLNEHQIN